MLQGTKNDNNHKKVHKYYICSRFRKLLAQVTRLSVAAAILKQLRRQLRLQLQTKQRTQEGNILLYKCMLRRVARNIQINQWEVEMAEKAEKAVVS